MRPRYEARVATMRHRHQGHHPWVLVRVTHGTDDGVPVEFTRVVASYADRDDAIAEAERREGMQEGLRRLGVAVAVWAGMAAVQERATGVIVLANMQARTESARALRMHRIALDLRNELAAERAARRKWELRLRARSQARAAPAWQVDLLLWRRTRLQCWQTQAEWGRTWWDARPIAGPRGVLP